MDAPFATFRSGPLKMFHHIGDINFRAINASLSESLIEDSSRWPNEWAAGSIFLIARLLAYHHDRSGRFPFSENGLRPCFP